MNFHETKIEYSFGIYVQKLTFISGIFDVKIIIPGVPQIEFITIRRSY